MSNRNFDGFASVEAREEYLEHNMAPQPSTVDDSVFLGDLVSIDQAEFEVLVMGAVASGRIRLEGTPLPAAA